MNQQVLENCVRAADAYLRAWKAAVTASVIDGEARTQIRQSANALVELERATDAAMEALEVGTW